MVHPAMIVGFVRISRTIVPRWSYFSAK